MDKCALGSGKRTLLKCFPGDVMRHRN
jgi:hypothetical protein